MAARRVGSVDALVAVTSRGELPGDFGNVIEAASFEGHIDDGVTEVDAVVGAIVRGLHDVGAGIGDDFRELMQRTGAIGEVDSQAGTAAVLDQAALDDFGKQADVDVASADEDGGSLSVERGLALEQ